MKYVKIVLAFYFLISSINRMISEEDLTFILADSNSYYMIKWTVILAEIIIAVSIFTGKQLKLGITLGFVLITPVLIISLINTMLGSDLNCQIGYLELNPPLLLLQSIFVYTLLIYLKIKVRK